MKYTEKIIQEKMEQASNLKKEKISFLAISHILKVSKQDAIYLATATKNSNYSYFLKKKKCKKK